MPSLPKQLPDDIDSLKILVAEQATNNEKLRAQKRVSEQENARLNAKVLSLQEQLNLALARRYAASSEKLSPDQIRLFDEAEVEAQKESPEDETVTVPEHSRWKRGRKKLPDSLSRIDIVHELAADERRCPHDGGVLAEIGEVTSEQLDIVPAKIQVIRHIRKQYACKYLNTRMPCPCIVRRRSCVASALNYPGRPWPTG